MHAWLRQGADGGARGAAPGAGAGPGGAAVTVEASLAKVATANVLPPRAIHPGWGGRDPFAV